MNSSKTADTLVLVGGQLAVASAALMARGGLDAGLSPLALAAWRLVLASTLLLVAVRLWAWRRRSEACPLPRKDQVVLVVAGACLGFHFAAWFASLLHISVAVSTLLVSTSPVWAGLVEAWIMHKPPKPSFWLGLGVALAGLGFVVAESPTTARGSVVLGCAWATIGAMLIAAYLLLTHRSQIRYGTTRTVCWTYSSAGVTLALAAALFSPPTGIEPIGWTAWGAVIGMALIPQILGHTSLNYALQRFRPGVVGVSTLLEPVFAAALAWPMFGEPVTALQVVGALVLFAGVGTVLAQSEPVADSRLLDSKSE